MKNIPSKSRVAGYWMVWDIRHHPMYFVCLPLINKCQLKLTVKILSMFESAEKHNCSVIQMLYLKYMIQKIFHLNWKFIMWHMSGMKIPVLNHAVLECGICLHVLRCHTKAYEMWQLLLWVIVSNVCWCFMFGQLQCSYAMKIRTKEQFKISFEFCVLSILEFYFIGSF